MKLHTRFAIFALIPLGCATGENTPSGDNNYMLGPGGTAGDTAGASGTATGGTGTVLPQAGSTTASGSGGSGVAGTGVGVSGTFGNAGTFGMGGTTSMGGAAGAGGTASTGGASAGAGTAGKAAGGSAGTAAGGTAAGGTAAGGTAAGGAGAGGTGVVGPYCNSHAKSPLPYTVNDGFQPSGWQGDITAISSPTVAPDPCASRTAGAVGICSHWRFTPNATTPAWAGVAWSKVFDANFTHDPVCVADGATKLTFQARGAVGGELVTFSGAGAAEVPFTLTAAWQEYQISLVGVQYNTAADGVDSGFFWKAGPATPGGAPVTFFVDDIQFIQ